VYLWRIPRLIYGRIYVIIIMSGGETRTTKNLPALPTPGERREGWKLDGYTEYGYELDGVEYATVDEAYEAQE